MGSVTHIHKRLGGSILKNTDFILKKTAYELLPHIVTMKFIEVGEHISHGRTVLA